MKTKNKINGKWKNKKKENRIKSSLLFTTLTLINIDAAYKLHLILIQGCYCCGNLNYVVCKCLVRLDVRQLNTEKWKKLTENLNTLKYNII